MERLQKIIAQAGIASRRKAEELIVAGKVKVNGELVTELGYKVKGNETIEVNGKIINKEEKVYYILNKPSKTLCSVSDDRDRKTVVELINDKRRIFPVGRLDYETTGVLLLTNDGEFANDIIHPSSNIEKTYEVAINGILEDEQLWELRKGIELEDGLTLPCKVDVISKNMPKNKEVLQISIHEGRNRIIRRMMEYFGFEVTRLDRKSLGIMTYNGLKQGEYRIMKPYEIKQMLNICKKYSK